MAINQGLFGSEKLHFPQPSKPFYTADYIVSDSNMSEARIPNQLCEEYCNNREEPSTTPPEERSEFASFEDDLVYILEEFVVEANDKGRGLLNKLLSSVENEARFHKLRVLSERGGPTSMERGVHVDSSTMVDEIKGKLERFKVKTINLGGIVKVQPRR